MSPKTDDEMSEAETDGEEGVSRIRLYPTTHTGPYTVYVRKIDKPLKPLYHTVYVNKNYKSVTSSEHSRDKMIFVLGDIAEANKFIVDTHFVEYRVFINAEEVEVDGVIKFSDLCDIQKLSELVQHGIGIFDNSAQLVKVVDVHQFPAKTAGELSNAVKITFEGLVVPTHVKVFGLRVKVRPWFQRPMFCDRCQHFKHTNKFCTRPAKCAMCFGDHLSSECINEEVDHKICPYCQTEHETGKKNCAYFKKVNKDFFKIQKRNYVRKVADNPAPQNLPTNIALEDASQWPAISSGIAGSANCPPVVVATTSHNQQMAAGYDPFQASNSFAILENAAQDCDMTMINKPKRPQRLPFANPYAANPNIANSSKKRKLDQVPSTHRPPISVQASHKHEPSSSRNLSTPDTNHHTSPVTGPPGFRQPGNANPTGRRAGPPRQQQPLNSLIVDMICKVAVSLGLSEHWLTIKPSYR